MCVSCEAQNQGSLLLIVSHKIASKLATTQDIIGDETLNRNLVKKRLRDM